MTALAEVAAELESHRYQANQIYTEAIAGGSGFDWANVKVIPGSNDEKQAKWAQLNLRMTELGQEHDRLKLVENEMKQASAAYQQGQMPANSPPFAGSEMFNFTPRPASIKEMIANSPEFKVLQQRKSGTAQIEIPEYKTLITLTTVSPQNDRNTPVNMRLEERTVMDMIGTSPASSATVEWYEETTVTNAAVEIAEGSAKPEGALAWTLRTTPIKTIAVWIPITTQALDDNDFLEAQIRNRLIFMVQRREEGQILTGDGAGENIRGILNTSGIQTQAKGADSTATAVFKALQKVRGASGSGFAEPDGIVLHPNDYTEMYNAQATTGEFIMQAILQQNPDPRLWGFQIRQTTAMTENTGLVGAFALGAEVFTRGGLVVKASTEHASYFIENKVAILAEARIGLAVQIPTAFCTVTGI